MKQYRLILLLLLILITGPLSAQILNDTTRNVYNPKTTRVFREGEYLRGNFAGRTVDTTLNNINRERNWYHDSTFYQDLGNVGTAARPVLWRFPERIGARFGRNVFDRYFYDPTQVDYFDTKSPFTRLFYVQGQQGQQVFEAKHVRSIKELASFGIAFQRMSAEKQIGLTAQRKQGQVDNLGFVFFSHFQNKSGRYQMFANYSIGKHEQIETGGIRYGNEVKNFIDINNGENPLDSVYQNEDAAAYLYNAASEERRNQLHLTHFLQLAKEYFKVYHTLDYRSQRNIFYDNQLRHSGSTTGGDYKPYYYPRFLQDSTQTDDQSRYRELENTVGLTGNHPLFFYNVYAKRRDYQVLFATFSQRLDPVTGDTIFVQKASKGGQNFIGGETQFKLKDIFNITVKGEYQLFQDYQLTAAARVKFLTFSQSRLSYSPSLMQQSFTSNHYDWDRDFKNTIADRTAAGISGKLWNNSLELEVARINLQNYVLYNFNAFATQNPRTDVISSQIGSQLSFYTATLHHHLQLRKLHLDHFLAYNQLDKAKEVRMPTWLVNSKIYVEGYLFKKALYSQVGIETNIQDDYMADGYNPVLQQFYLQNEFTLPTYPVVDVFLTADIRNFNLFLKMSHVNQGYPQKGYFTTPFYTGMPRSFIFGLKWMFFD